MAAFDATIITGNLRWKSNGYFFAVSNEMVEKTMNDPRRKLTLLIKSTTDVVKEIAKNNFIYMLRFNLKLPNVCSLRNMVNLS